MPQTHSRRRKRRRSWPRTILLLVFVFAALAAVYRILIRKPQLATGSSQLSTSVQAGQAAASAGSVSADSVDPGPDRYARKDDFFTILVSGMDNDNGGSDTNILVAFDAGENAVHCVSIPRDSGVYYNGKAQKVNVPSKTSVRTLADTLADTLGIPVDFTVQVDLKGFVKLVDAIGGVDFYVPENMDYDDPVQDLHIHFQKGTQHLNGTDALKVVRFRHNNDDTGYGGRQDLGRIDTQQAFLKAVAKKMLSNPQKIGDYAKIFDTYVDTDLRVNELAWFGEQAILMGLDAIQFSTLPGEWSGSRSLYLLDGEAVLELVNDSLNPYLIDRTADDLNLVS